MIPLASKGFLSDGRSKILFGNLNALVPRANQVLICFHLFSFINL